jgi:hypothetical protein
MLLLKDQSSWVSTFTLDWELGVSSPWRDRNFLFIIPYYYIIIYWYYSNHNCYFQRYRSNISFVLIDTSVRLTARPQLYARFRQRAGSVSSSLVPEISGYVFWTLPPWSLVRTIPMRVSKQPAASIVKWITATKLYGVTYKRTKFVMSMAKWNSDY